MSSRSGYHQVTTIIGVGIICMTIVSFIYFARSNPGDGGRQQPDLDTELNYRELRELQSTYAALSKQYESLYEYKERLEKSYLNLKNEKAALVESDKNENVEFTELKELYSKQVQTLQDELKTCHDELNSYILSSKNANAAAALAGSQAGDPSSADVANNELYKTHDNDGVLSGGGGGPLSQSLRLPILTASQSPLNQDLAALPQPEYGDKSRIHGGLHHRPSSAPFSGSSSVNKGGAGSGSHVRVAIDNSIVSNVLKEPIQSPIAQVPMEPQQPSSDPNQDIAGNVLI